MLRAALPVCGDRLDGDGGGLDWRGDVEWKWGTRALNLPVAIRAPGGWADALQSCNGRGVWDWQSHRSNVLARSGADIVPLGIAHGAAGPAATEAASSFGLNATSATARFCTTR